MKTALNTARVWSTPETVAKVMKYEKIFRDQISLALRYPMKTAKKAAIRTPAITKRILSIPQLHVPHFKSQLLQINRWILHSRDLKRFLAFNACHTFRNVIPHPCNTTRSD